MRFFFDNNLSKYLAHGLHELCGGDPGPPQVIHLTDRFARNTPDTVWIDALAAEGGWVVVSQDHFNKNDAEREALRRSGLIVFALHSGWTPHTHWNKAHNLVRWWPSIIDQAGRIQGGAAFRVHWRFTGRFEQIR